MLRFLIGTWVLLIVHAALGCSGEQSEPAVGEAARAHAPDKVAFRAPSLSHPGVQLSRIALENARPGSSAWRLEQPARAHEVEGYASQISARRGDRVRLYVHVSEPHAVHYELYRMGYYQGLGGRFIASAAPRQLEPQASCPIDASSGLVECRWSPSFELTIEPDWITGQYYFKLIRDDGYASYVPLVIKEPERHAKVIVQSSVTTWQAYNVYGGSSLYRNNLPPELNFKRKHADAVSFNRPYTCQDLSSADCQPGAGDYELGERYLNLFLEQRGIEIAYVTNLDVDPAGEPDLLQDRTLYITVGHDEYWNLGERTALEQARDRGVSLFFLSANVGYWRVRFEPDSDGTARRTMVCYKESERDPVQGPENTTEYRFKPQSHPEQALIGVMYDDDGSRTYFDAFAPVVARADHWIFAGTGVHDGDVLSHIVGYEFDHAFENNDAPAGRELVTHSNLIGVRAHNIAHDMSVYYPTDHNLVFGGGSIYWARGLTHPLYKDARVVRMFENLLARAGVPTDVSDAMDSGSEPAAYGGMEVLAGSSDAEGPSVMGAPVGLALAPDGTLFFTDNTQHAVLELKNDGTVTLVAGCGHPGNMDGVGNTACFRNPTGLVRLDDGSLIVADTGNCKLRKIFADGSVETLAGTGKAGKSDSADPLTGQLTDPRGLALAKDGTLYIADSGSSNIRRLDASGLTTALPSYYPTAVTIGPDATLYYIQTRGGTIERNGPSGSGTLAGAGNQFGDADGPGAMARLRPSDGIALDGARVVFTDSANHKLRVYDPASGEVSTLAGDGSARVLQMPRGVLVTPDGYIVADTGNHRIVRIRRQ